jgi:hypothetical protein
MHTLRETAYGDPVGNGNGNGNGTDDLTTVISGELVRRDRPKEQTEIERRRQHVLHMRFVLRLTEREIVARLARLTPPILTPRTTVSRDVQTLRSTFRRTFSQRHFDPRAEVGIVVSGIEHVIAKSFRDARRATDGKERALHRKVALDAFEKLTTWFQDLGLVDRRDFLVPVNDGKRADRIPSGVELAELLRDVVVTDADITSEAETAWLQGDWAASHKAARDARDSRGDPHD